MGSSISFFLFCHLCRVAISVAGLMTASQERQFAMKNRMFGGIGAMALAFTLAIVGVDAFAYQAKAADKKTDSMLKECAKACSDCQLVCDHCVTHCANLLADGKKEHLSCLMHCRDCAACCAACSQICASGGPLSSVMADCCAKACGHCAKACEAFPEDAHYKACAAECRKCEKACKAIAN